MTAAVTEARPEWRDVKIDLLAQRMYAAHTLTTWGAAFKLDTATPEDQAAWKAAAEAAVDELIDRPEREFQAQCTAVLKRPVAPWQPASAVDWLPEHA